MLGQACVCVCVFTCVFLIPECHWRPHSSRPCLWNMKGKEGRDLLPKWKTTTWNRAGTFFLSFFSPRVIILLYLFAQQTSCSRSNLASSILHISLAFPPAASLSQWSGCEPCRVVQAAPQRSTMHTYISRRGSNSPACSLMNAARCFVEEGSFSLINVLLLHGPEDT